MLWWVNHERQLEIRYEVIGALHEGEAPKLSFILILMSSIKLLIRSHSTQNAANVLSFSSSLEIFLDIIKHILLQSSFEEIQIFSKIRLKFVFSSRYSPWKVGTVYARNRSAKF